MNLKDMKPKTCERCGDSMELHEWGSQDFYYNDGKWQPKYALDFTYFCPNKCRSQYKCEESDDGLLRYSEDEEV